MIQKSYSIHETFVIDGRISSFELEEIEDKLVIRWTMDSENVCKYIVQTDEVDVSNVLNQKEFSLSLDNFEICNSYEIRVIPVSESNKRGIEASKLYHRGWYMQFERKIYWRIIKSLILLALKVLHNTW